MAIEVKELIIKANVQGQAAAGGGKGKMAEEAKAEIIATCMEQMMKLLNRKKER